MKPKRRKLSIKKTSIANLNNLNWLTPDELLTLKKRKGEDAQTPFCVTYYNPPCQDDPFSLLSPNKDSCLNCV